MNWEQLLCTKRERASHSQNPDDVRSEFRKDYHRIIGSASFRRLQDKAQVYPLTRGDFVRTRLTHSLEVSSFAVSLGDTIFRRLIAEGHSDVNDKIREDCCSILECAGLVHDIGNPPFGHFGEFAIRQWFVENFKRLEYRGVPVRELLTHQMKSDFLNFDGNAQGLRVLSRLHCLVDMSTGMNLTYALLNTIIKYPICSTDIDKKSGDIIHKKMGYFTSEQALYEEISENTGAVGMRYPLTFILEAADDIAYKTADIEDAAVKGLLSYEALLSELRSEKALERCEDEKTRELLENAADELEKSFSSASSFATTKAHRRAIQRWIIKVQNMFIYAASDTFCRNYDDIMNGEFKRELLQDSPAAVLSDILSDVANRYAFRSPLIFKNEISETAVMNLLLDKIVAASLRFDTENEKIFDRDLSEALSENYLEICRRNCVDKSPAEQAYYRLLFATDCISGMTDGYANEFFQMLNGNI